jgi:hypothetical protein
MTTRSVTVLLFWLLGSVAARGQVLLTGETGGSGAQGVVATGNVISPKGFANLANVWAQYGYGLTERIDLFASYGAMRVFQTTQHYVSVGSNLGILRRARHGLDVSLYGSLSTPLTRRQEASTLLVTVAVLASRPIRMGAFSLTPYVGLEGVAPVGARARGVFTSPETLYAGIVGAAIPLRKNWTAYVEYNPGPNLRSAGAGVALTLPRLRVAGL